MKIESLIIEYMSKLRIEYQESSQEIFILVL